MTTTPATETLYKVLNSDGSVHHGGNGKWFLPNGRPGKWMPALDPDKLKACVYGYHLCRRDDVIQWLGPAIFMAEYKGKRIDDIDKIVVQQARLISKLKTWNDRTARLFACDCAERALALMKKPDPRSIESVRVARLYAMGEAKKEQLAAAGDAARAAAWASARDASWASARDASWAAARAAARDASWDAARDAAWAAARDAAWDAERTWQTERLFEYLITEEKYARQICDDHNHKTAP